MSVSYNKLWKLLISKNMSKTQLIGVADITINAMAHLGKNDEVRVGVLIWICDVLDCNIDENIAPLEIGAA